MAVTRFEDLLVWQKSQDLAVLIYTHFSLCKDYGFKDQISRAIVSVSNNIAEGFERNSNADFSRFLYISLGSISEVRSMLYLSVRLEIISTELSEELIQKQMKYRKCYTA